MFAGVSFMTLGEVAVFYQTAELENLFDTDYSEFEFCENVYCTECVFFGECDTSKVNLRGIREKVIDILSKNPNLIFCL